MVFTAAQRVDLRRALEANLELAPSEQIVVVTDGVTESTDSRDREYGVDALWSLVRAEISISASKRSLRDTSTMSLVIAAAAINRMTSP